MTSVFDGVAELLADVVGSPVLHRPVGGDPVQIDSVFRLEPTEVLDEDGGPVLVLNPTWRVPATRATGIALGDLIEPWDGNTYEVINRLQTASPAADRFVLYEVEEVS